MSSSSDSSGECPSRFAGNTQLRQHGCYVDLDGALFEVPRLDCEQNLRWALFSQSVDVIYPALMLESLSISILGTAIEFESDLNFLLLGDTTS